MRLHGLIVMAALGTLMAVSLAACSPPEQLTATPTGTPTPTPTSTPAPAPINLTGVWRGGINIREWASTPRCGWTADLTLDLTQTGQRVTGTSYTVYKTVTALVPGAPCPLYPPEVSQLSGTVAGDTGTFFSSVDGAAGVFNAIQAGDSLSGNYTLGAKNQDGYQGCFETRRGGAVGRTACTIPVA